MAPGADLAPGCRTSRVFASGMPSCPCRAAAPVRDRGHVAPQGSVGDAMDDCPGGTRGDGDRRARTPRSGAEIRGR